MKLFLIDGSALAYRSYFAFSSNPLTNRRGMQTSAVYGFVTALLRLMEKEKPDYFAVVFDAPEPTFRHKQLKTYKATREKMPDEMADQLPYIRKVVEAMRLPFLILPTYEADDIIGTVAEKAAHEKIDTYIVSGDKDLLQLLGPHVRVYNLKKAGEVEILEEKDVPTKWGVRRDQIVDLLALMGDSSDNIPGVPGIGEKTAGKLMAQFGSLKNIYDHLDEVTPEKLREKLKTHRADAELAQRLVTLDKNVPIGVDIHHLKIQPPDVPALRSLYEELDFQSLLKALGTSPSSTRTNATKEHYLLVDSLEELRALENKLRAAPAFAFDTEATSLNVVDTEIVGISFSAEAGSAYFVPLRRSKIPPKEVWKLLAPILEDEKRPKGGQNVKFDMAVLRNAGVTVRGITFDTMLASYLLESESRQHNLDSLALKHLGIQKISFDELIGDADPATALDAIDLNRLSHYACEDADVTWRLNELFSPQLAHQELERLYRDVEVPLAEVLSVMERTGFAVDVDRLTRLSKELEGKLAKLTQQIHRVAGEEFNINSPKQLGPILFEKLRVQGDSRRVKKTKTGYATDQDTLEAYAAHPIVNALLEFRNLSKLRSTYTETLPTLVHPKSGRIHSSFNQTIAATGRLSSSDPNLQNIPIRTELGKEIRKAFIPGFPGWKILSADYSQVELRILAHLSEDKTFLETFRRNEDVHRRTAALIFDVPPEKVTPELRGRAKAINFGILYGMGPQRLARETGISMDEATAFINAYFEKHPRVRSFLDRLVEDARDKGYVTTILGRRRGVPDITSGNPRLESNAERIAVNTPIQGSAADLIKVAMVRIQRRLEGEKRKARMLLQVHDELVFEVPEAEIKEVSALVREEMEGAIQLKVPLVVDLGVGANWAEAH